MPLPSSPSRPLVGPPLVDDFHPAADVAKMSADTPLEIGVTLPLDQPVDVLVDRPAARIATSPARTAVPSTVPGKEA